MDDVRMWWIAYEYDDIIEMLPVLDMNDVTDDDLIVWARDQKHATELFWETPTGRRLAKAKK